MSDSVVDAVSEVAGIPYQRSVFNHSNYTALCSLVNSISRQSDHIVHRSCVSFLNQWRPHSAELLSRQWMRSVDCCFLLLPPSLSARRAPARTSQRHRRVHRRMIPSHVKRISMTRCDSVHIPWMTKRQALFRQLCRCNLHALFTLQRVAVQCFIYILMWQSGEQDQKSPSVVHM